uniref:Protein Wnt n=1 Tax=Rhabditophanes sp. KR3021 TaxID=114890 RepID=A0AC35TIG4_9BILA
MAWYSIADRIEKIGVGSFNDFDCSKYAGFTSKQLQMCKDYPEAMYGLLNGIKRAADQCQKQFHGEIWDCKGQAGFGVDIGKEATREASFVYAIVSASVSQSISKACRAGIIPDCGCGELPRGSIEDTFQWSGCADNVRFSNYFTKRFLDSPDKMTKSAGSLMNRHNSQAGRKAVLASMVTKCKCHGIFGLCYSKTCYKVTGTLDDISSSLKSRYEEAKRVIATRYFDDLFPYRERERRELYFGKGERSIVKSTRNSRRSSLRMDELVFLEDSYGHCSPTASTGRVCTERTCPKMCCGKGWTTTIQTVKVSCNCQFVYCCDVKCDQCEQQITKHTCN